jgi:hypothetical protein
LDQQHSRALQSKANHQPPPPFAKIKLCLTLTKGVFPLSRKWDCRSQKEANSYGIAFSVENLRFWFGNKKLTLYVKK